MWDKSGDFGWHMFICKLEMWVIVFAVLKFGQVWDKRQFYSTHSMFTDGNDPGNCANDITEFWSWRWKSFLVYCAEKPMETLLPNPCPKDSNLAMSRATRAIIPYYPYYSLWMRPCSSLISGSPLSNRYQVSNLFSTVLWHVLLEPAFFGWPSICFALR